ncbi:MAG: hypothetical protein HY825_05945 [Acidobacteria bacterium]|nr:hypothetical protein [Acidobacteriota bacterium]
MAARQFPRGAAVLMSLVVVAMTAPASLYAQIAAINPGFPTCMPEEGNSVVTATLVPEHGWATVRTYFRELGSNDWYWVEARNESRGAYWGVLPRPEDETTAVEMQIVAKDADGKETKTPIQKVSVTSSCKPVFTPPQAHLAQNLVVGETIIGQRDKEILGFICPGVISRVDYTGELKPDEYCRKAGILLAASAQNKAALIPLLVLGGGGGVIAIVDDDDPPASPSRP